MDTGTHNRIDVEQVKARANILSVIGRTVELRQRGRDWWGCCPFHAENTPSFKVDPAKGFFHCFGCDAGGDVIRFVMDLHHLDFPAAVELLDGKAWEPYQAPTAAPAGPAHDHRGGDWRQCLTGLQALADSPGEAYLRRRGIDPVFPICRGMLYSPAWGWTRDDNAGGWRPFKYPRPAVVYPLRDAKGALVAVEGRFIDGKDGTDPERYKKTCCIGQKGCGVFATPDAFTQATALICEGPVNAISLALCGFPALATCGTGNRPGWLPAACAGKRVVIAFDPDTAGIAAARKLAGHFATAGVIAYELPITQAGADWNDLLQRYGREVLQQALLRAMRGLDGRNGVATANPPPAPGGARVRAINGQWAGVLLALHPPDEDWPAGWCEVWTDDGQAGQAAADGVCDADGKPLAIAP